MKKKPILDLNELSSRDLGKNIDNQNQMNMNYNISGIIDEKTSSINNKNNSKIPFHKRYNSNNNLHEKLGGNFSKSNFKDDENIRINVQINNNILNSSILKQTFSPIMISTDPILKNNNTISTKNIYSQFNENLNSNYESIDKKNEIRNRLFQLPNLYAENDFKKINNYKNILINRNINSVNLNQNNLNSIKKNYVKNENIYQNINMINSPVSEYDSKNKVIYIEN